MNDRSTDSAIQNEKAQAAHEWLDQSGNNASSIEYTGQSDEFPSHTMTLTSLRMKVKRKEEGPLEIVCGWAVRHQIGLSVNLLMLLALTHMCFPRARRHTRKFFELSYYNPQSGGYCAGWNDAFMVFYWIVVFTGLRTAVMDYILIPLSQRGGVKTERNQTRFAEQAWLLIYYSVFWTLGTYILINSDYWLNLKELWMNWPNREMDGLTKWYILVQYAFWLQQILVINIEKRRKDHWQMFTHHIVTTMLIFTSYGYHQTKVANLILCIMDVVDLFFPLAKCLKYLGYGRICDVIFGLFMMTWIAARHVAYLMVCYSVYVDIPTTIPYGCYRGKNGAITGPFPPPNRFFHLLEPFQNPNGVICWNDEIKWGFLSALLFLHGIMLMWFWMIIQVAIKVIRGGEADDVRSSAEDEEECTDNVEEKTFTTIGQTDEAENIQPLEEEVGVEDINLKGWTSNTSKNKYRKSTGSASGVSVPGHSDRKELLGRIGCDKGM